MNNSSGSDPQRELLRHALATLAYRGGKAVRNAPENLSTFRASDGVRTPGRILTHIGDLMDWALTIAMGRREWTDSKPLPWVQEVDRFFAAVKKLDDYLASSEPLHTLPEKLLQGPIADAFTHVGQIVMLRRMAGAPVRSESYYEAEILPGRVGPDQVQPKREF
ncbi:MAG: hypothetical protein WBX38_18185 [Candidatus Sulfotelmatobacter sp.]